jgi:hypothetical protein
VSDPTDELEPSNDGPVLIVAERCQTLYVRVAKAACTTVLWGLLELEGHDPAMMNDSLQPLLSTKDVLVHDRSLYPVPLLSAVSPSVRTAALTSPSWLRVAVVRNPYARVYSAWESKVLLQTWGNRRYGNTSPLVENENGIDVGASFRSFVGMLAEDPERWMSDRHFKRQADVVPTATVDDIEIVPTSGIVALFDRLSARAGRVVTPRRSNEGLGIDGTVLLDDEAAEKIARLYASDFELTGADPAAYTQGEPIYLDPTAVRLLRLAIARSERTVILQQAFRRTPEQRAGSVIRRLFRGHPGR